MPQCPAPTPPRSCSRGPLISPSFRSSSTAAVLAGPPSGTVEALPGYDDGAWKVVDLPHDASVEHSYTPDAAHGEGFISNVQTFYRKHLALPAELKGRALTLEVDGALMYSSWWVNGVRVRGL